MEDTQTTIETSRILEDIIYSGKLGESFIPEIDGIAMLKEMLPISQAIASGKDSPLYKKVAFTYQAIMKELFKIQKEIIAGGVLAIPIEPMTLDHYDSRRDRFQSEDLTPHQGTFGIYFKD